MRLPKLAATMPAPAAASDRHRPHASAGDSSPVRCVERGGRELKHGVRDGMRVLGSRGEEVAGGCVLRMEGACGLAQQRVQFSPSPPAPGAFRLLLLLLPLLTRRHGEEWLVDHVNVDVVDLVDAHNVAVAAQQRHQAEQRLRQQCPVYAAGVLHKDPAARHISTDVGQ